MDEKLQRPHHIAVLTRPECCTAPPATDWCDPRCVDITVECPGVSERCRAWQECSTCEPRTEDTEDAYYNDSELHGVEHRMIDGCLMVPTTRCYVASHHALTDAAGDLDLPPGRYPIEHDVGDGTELYLSLVREPLVAAGSGGEEGL